MYTVELTVWERLQLDMALPRNAPLKEIGQLLRIMNIVALTDAEKEAIGFGIETIQTQQGPYDIRNWDKEKSELGLSHQFKLETEDFNLLVVKAKARQNWPTDTRTINLFDMLDGAKED